MEHPSGLRSIGQCHSCEHLPMVIGQCPIFVNHQRLREPGLVAGMGHVWEETEGIRIGQWTMLGPVLDVVPPLNKMQTPCFADIGSDKDVSLAVEIQSRGIYAVFRKQLNKFGRGVIMQTKLSKEI